MAQCPVCNHEGEPKVDRQISVTGWVVFAALLFVCFPLCWIPFVVDGCKEDVFRCESCGAKIGTS